MRKTLLTLLAFVACGLAAQANVYGDVNGDGDVSVVDVTAVYNYLLEGDETFLATSDIDGDGYITVADITIIYNIILGMESPVEPPAPVTEFTVNGVTFRMIEVEGGTFMMGIDQYVGNAYPAHEVTLSTYWIGETEVTQELWEAVMGSNPSYFNGTGGAMVHEYDYGTNLQRPVESINISDCQAFCAALSQLTGKTFRIPTEAEWEFAARGGNLTHGYEYAGSESADDVAWYRETVPSLTIFTEGSGTQTVATKAPNELGIYDMCGNVDEWCMDWFATYGNNIEPQTNPTGPETGTYRVFRGGRWNSYAVACRVFIRDRNLPDAKGNGRGLRLAMEAE
ncbi:MAG: SUMF1/EgtB/PvdO family nonheme iron enzyme [Muribaculaceae bacterium]|nr:SUMF1/EgtB/PvdO family nonheme iron enzyme [Muribaculaceae bacterium]